MVESKKTTQHGIDHTKTARESAVAGDPGYGLGLAGFIVSFFVSLAGLIMSAIALKQSKDAGKKNGFALAGLIIGIVKTVIDVLAVAGFIVLMVVGINYCNENPSECRESNTNGGSMYRSDDAPVDKTY